MQGINSSPEREIGSNREEVEGRSRKKARKRGHWTPVEDENLKRLVEDYGEHNWNQIAHNLEGRSAQSCMQRWHNRPFDETEERRLLGALGFLGNKWSWIAVLFPGRTADAVKKQWLEFMARKRRDENTGDAKRKKGIDGRYTRCRAGEMNIGCSSNGTENGTSSNAVPQALASESHRNHEERELTVPSIDFCLGWSFSQGHDEILSSVGVGGNTSMSTGTENGTSSNVMPQALASDSHQNHEERELTVPFIDFFGIGSI